MGVANMGGVKLPEVPMTGDAVMVALLENRTRKTLPTSATTFC